MRDPARISRILELLRQRWQEAPDQRLGQLVVNFMRCERTPNTWSIDVFAREDDALEASLARGWEQFKLRPLPCNHFRCHTVAGNRLMCDACGHTWCPVVSGHSRHPGSAFVALLRKLTELGLIDPEKDWR